MYTPVFNDLAQWFVPILSFVFAVFGGWFGLKIQNRALWRDIKALEDDHNALVERFNRRQNRESMREARAAKETEKALLERAKLAALEAGTQVPPETVATDSKAALRQRIYGKH